MKVYTAAPSGIHEAFARICEDGNQTHGNFALSLGETHCYFLPEDGFEVCKYVLLHVPTGTLWERWAACFVRTGDYQSLTVFYLVGEVDWDSEEDDEDFEWLDREDWGY